MEKYVQPFIDSCCNVFRNFVGLEIKAQIPHFIERSDDHDWDISSIIGLTGEAQGAVVLSLKTDLALKIANLLTEENHNTLDENVLDAVGEIVNIIAGNVKRDLEEMFKLVISLPTIVIGENHSTLWTSSQNARAICIPFTVADTYTFSLSVALKG